MKENSREEDIKILEEHAQFYLNDEDRQSLQNLIEAYKELEKENEKYKKAIDVVNKEKADWIRAYQEEKDKQFGFINKMSSNNLILKQEIKNKIKELNKYYKKEIYPELYSWSDLTITEHYDEMIELLQELLKGREE